MPERLDGTDDRFLVECLSRKEKNIKYHAFLLLKWCSYKFPYIFQQWNVLEGKLKSNNSFQRSIGLMLLADNLRDRGRFVKTLDNYLYFVHIRNL